MQRIITIFFLLCFALLIIPGMLLADASLNVELSISAGYGAGTDAQADEPATTEEGASEEETAKELYHYTYHFYLGINDLFIEDYVLALEDFSHVIELNPDLGMAYYYRGLAHAQLDQLAEAGHDFVRFLERVPRRPDSLFEGKILLRGRCYAAAGYVNLALNDLLVFEENTESETAEMTLVPREDTFEINLILGDLFYTKRMVEKAQIYYEKTVELASTDEEEATAYSRLARAYYDQLLIANAIVTIKKSLAIDPENEGYKRALHQYELFYPDEVEDRGYSIFPDDYATLSESK